MCESRNNAKSLISSLPKVELHAHLSGSLSDETVAKLLKDRQKKDLEVCLPSSLVRSLTLGDKRTLSECFDIFKIIHSLMDDINFVKMITLDVIKEFSEENVRYLELRTTPKAVACSFSKWKYLEAVFQSVMEAEHSFGIVVRVLLSIDRSRGLSDAWDTLNLAKECCRHDQFRKYLCGIDVSGNPVIGSLKDYIPVLQEAKKMGLKLAVHLLEVNSETAFEEAYEVLNRGLVDRIGHGTFLHSLSGGSKILTNIVKNNNIPIELCISSNLKCGSVSSLNAHHAKLWKTEKHPISICTDDKGVFSTTLTNELLLFKELMEGEVNVEELALTSLESSFLQENDKLQLIDRVQRELANVHNVT